MEKRELNNYTIFNLKFDHALMNDRLNLYLGADNLFDKDYEQSFGVPRPGRMIYGGLRLSY